MKKGLLILLFITALVFIQSCGDDDNITTTELEGSWLLQSIPSAARLTFTGSEFTIKSGTVTIKGNFTLAGETLKGKVKDRLGTYAGGLQPDEFEGKVEIENSTAYFSEFSGNWRAVFSSWYSKVD